MSSDTKIQWTDATFNPWRGCTKISEGCKFCYAETLSKRNPRTLGVWGPMGTREPASESYWKEPVKWNREAQKAGTRTRVFCASLADVFEGPETCQDEAAYRVVEEGRERLFHLIEVTPFLDWQLLTKRPENVMTMVPDGRDCMDWTGGFPANVWIGTSVENQKAANERIPHLLMVPAKVRFLSCEPLIGAVDLTAISGVDYIEHDSLTGEYRSPLLVRNTGSIQWVIAGGESGPHARPMYIEWVRSLRDQCVAANVPFFFKQHGEYLSLTNLEMMNIAMPNPCPVKVRKEGKYSDGVEYSYDEYWKVGKESAGHVLDGREWQEFPAGDKA